MQPTTDGKQHREINIQYSPEDDSLILIQPKQGSLVVSLEDVHLLIAKLQAAINIRKDN